MIELNTQTLGFVLRSLERACDRAALCLEEYARSNKDSDRIEAVFALGEASGQRNLLRHLTRDLPPNLAHTLHQLDQEVSRLKFVGN